MTQKQKKAIKNGRFARRCITSIINYLLIINTLQLFFSLSEQWISDAKEVELTGNAGKKNKYSRGKRRGECGEREGRGRRGGPSGSSGRGGYNKYFI